MAERKVKTIAPTVTPKGKEVQRLKVAAYVRVSTLQEEQESSLENQREYWTNKINNNPKWELEGIYADQGISGTKDERPQFQLMINKALSGEINLICTKSISRFSRNVKDLLHYLEQLNAVGVDVIFDEEQGAVDFNSSTGKVLLTMLGAIAEMEARNTSQHLSHTLKTRMREGKPVGSVPAGYKRVGDDYIIDEEKAPIIRRIFDLYLKGTGCHTIAKIFTREGVPNLSDRSTRWHESTIRQILKNEKYKGDLLQGKSYTTSEPGVRVFNQKDKERYYVEGAHPAIVSPEIWDKAQELMNKKKNRYGKGSPAQSNQHFATGKLRCLYCGKSFHRRTRPDTKPVWLCSTRTKQGAVECPHSFPVPEDYLKETFLRHLKGFLDGSNEVFSLSDEAILGYNQTLREEAQNIKNMIKSFDNEIDKNNKKIDRLQNGFLNGLFDEDQYKTKLEELNAASKNLVFSRRQAYEKLKKTTDDERGLEEAKKIILESGTDDFNEELFRLLVDQIVVGNLDDEGKPEDRIHWFFNFDHLTSKVDGVSITKDTRNTEAVDWLRERMGISGNFKHTDHIECVTLLTRKEDTASQKYAKIKDETRLENSPIFETDEKGSRSLVRDIERKTSVWLKTTKTETGDKF